MTKYKFNDEQFINAIKLSTSYRQVILTLNMNPKGGGNYDTIKTRIKNLNIDISHFNGKIWNKGKKFPYKKSIIEYLHLNSSIQSFKLKNRLIKEGILIHQCSICLGIKWNNELIPIELDHINGVHSDNRLENLRILCPNCHAQTANYCGKNKKSKK